MVSPDPVSWNTDAFVKEWIQFATLLYRSVDLCAQDRILSHQPPLLVPLYKGGLVLVEGIMTKACSAAISTLKTVPLKCSLQLQLLILVPEFKSRVILGSELPSRCSSRCGDGTPRYVSQAKSDRWRKWEGFVVGGESGEGALAIGTIAPAAEGAPETKAQGHASKLVPFSVIALQSQQMMSRAF